MRSTTDYAASSNSFTLDAAIDFTPEIGVDTFHVWPIRLTESGVLTELLKLTTGFAATNPNNLNSYLKAMTSKVSEVVIQFKSPPHLLFYPDPDRELNPDTLTLRLQPDEGVHLTFQVKVPDQGLSMRPVSMEFHYDSAFADQEVPEAYQRLLQDALGGDGSLFIRSDHIEEAWRIVDPLLQAWEDPSGPPLHIYEPGSQGPEAGDALLAQDGAVERVWAKSDH